VDFNNKLRPVPVQLENYRDTFKVVGTSALQYTRRFFLYDKVSGITKSGELPEIIRYAKKMTLRVTIRNDPTDAIFPPLLLINYGSSTTASILEDYNSRRWDSVRKESLAYPEVSFSAEYTMENGPYKKAFIVIVSLAVAFGFVLYIWRMYVWMKGNHNQMLNGPVCCLFWCNLCIEVFGTLHSLYVGHNWEFPILGARFIFSLRSILVQISKICQCSIT
jgi:hypothetical protein